MAPCLREASGPACATAPAHPFGEIREQAREGLSRQFQQSEQRLTEPVLERLSEGAPDADPRSAVIANCALPAPRAVLRTLRNRRSAGIPAQPDRLLPRAFTFLSLIGATSS
ncbi:hypothetical protein [Streptomyces sp. NPDC048643]|uniref:hypothetical protein n=1 Tax=Streptomyces sp. NPDC048643 TaxID=3155637 RepID=UPI0034384023